MRSKLSTSVLGSLCMLMLGIWAFWLEPASLNNEAYEIVCTSEGLI